MESFFSRYRNALVLIVVLLAQLLALAVQAKRPSGDGAEQQSVSLFRYVVVTVVTPPERLLHATGQWFSSLWFGYVDLIHVRRDNASLQHEVERLRLEQASIAQDAEQGRRLQHMLGFAEHYIYKTVPAQVIGTGGSDQSQVLYIDKGSEDGLAQDMPVTTADGIVGKLKDVFPHTSQVLLITDPTSGVGVILETTRTRGILKGRAYDQLQVIDVSPDSRIKSGESIITSGGDQVFPRGLPVGTVDRVIADPEHDPLVDVIVHPAAKISQLEEVLVITNLSDAVSPQEAKDLAESEAEGEAEQKRASDVLSERLPSRIDPNAPADTNPEQLVDAAGNALKPMAPPKPAHPDQFSPNAEPDASQMTPGQRWATV
jgi:rod shape-determining protein MreC